jgi:hypothetical protein
MPFRGWIEFAVALTSLAEDAQPDNSPEEEHRDD